MVKIPKLPDIPKEEWTPIVDQLLEIIHYHAEKIQILMDETAILKGNKPSPQIKPGRMENNKNINPGKQTSEGEQGSSAKKSKTEQLTIHETIQIKPETILKELDSRGTRNI